MPFKENNKHGKGRPPGKPNKLSRSAKAMIESVLNNNEMKFNQEMDGLKGYSFCKVYLELLQYVAAKMRSIDVSLDIDRLTEEQAEEIFQRLKDSIS